MARKLNVLQIGYTNIKPEILPLGLHWEWQDLVELEKLDSQQLKERYPKKFEVVIIEPNNLAIEWSWLTTLVDPYRVFYLHTDNESASSELLHWLQCKLAKPLSLDELEAQVGQWMKSLFPKQAYGEGYDARTISIHPTLQNQVIYEANHYVSFESESDDYRPILTWNRNIPVKANEPMELWLTQVTEGDCNLRLKLVKFLTGSVDLIEAVELVEISGRATPIIIESNRDLSVSVSLEAKGKGKARIGKFHWRESRLEQGLFLPGGKRIVDSYGDELIYYFHPGDLKPPLNVYFSGYRSLEGFEGFFMMEQLGSPFLLIGDPRLEGGAFYMGSEEYEQAMVQTIQKHLDYLGFTNQQLVLSGLSMGTYGALYYGALLEPAAIVLGKPLASIGTVALNGMLVRPTEFYTSFDVVYALTQYNNRMAARQVDERFWQQFKKGNFNQTLFAIAYMQQDDYDATAYYDVLVNLEESRSRVISKGFVGRHNDDSAGIFDWFFKQYQLIMQDQFQRE